MNALSQDELKTLLGEQKGLCISIFMPTFRTGTESQQNQIRLKNLLRSAEEKLLAGGRRAQEVKELLEPAQALTGNVRFWRRQSEGLALFLAQNFFRSFCLPEGFEESVTVGEKFLIGPLLPLLKGDRRFYILALSQNEVRLLAGTAQDVREIELASLPESLVAALQVDEVDKQVRFRAGSVSGGMAMVSGHGGVPADVKDNLLKYFRLIDKGLRDFFRDERAPLVLSGVEYLFPIYREANTYPYLSEEGIPGNPEGMTPEALYRPALKIVRPFYQKAEQDAIAHYRQSAGTGLASAEVREIVPASTHGRVGLLFIAAGCRQWGVFHRENDAVELRGKKEAQSEDLLEIAAVQTYLNGGTVFILPPEEMPVPQPLAAVFRY